MEAKCSSSSAPQSKKRCELKHLDVALHPLKEEFMTLFASQKIISIDNNMKFLGHLANCFEKRRFSDLAELLLHGQKNVLNVLLRRDDSSLSNQIMAWKTLGHKIEIIIEQIKNEWEAPDDAKIEEQYETEVMQEESVNIDENEDDDEQKQGIDAKSNDEDMSEEQQEEMVDQPNPSAADVAEVAVPEVPKSSLETATSSEVASAVEIKEDLHKESSEKNTVLPSTSKESVESRVLTTVASKQEYIEQKVESSAIAAEALGGDDTRMDLVDESGSTTVPSTPLQVSPLAEVAVPEVLKSSLETATSSEVASAVEIKEDLLKESSEKNTVLPSTSKDLVESSVFTTEASKQESVEQKVESSVIVAEESKASSSTDNQASEEAGKGEESHPEQQNKDGATQSSQQKPIVWNKDGIEAADTSDAASTSASISLPVPQSKA